MYINIFNKWASNSKLVQYLRLNYIQYWVKGINEKNKTEIIFIFVGRL